MVDLSVDIWLHRLRIWFWKIVFNEEHDRFHLHWKIDGRFCRQLHVNRLIEWPADMTDRPLQFSHWYHALRLTRIDRYSQRSQFSARPAKFRAELRICCVCLRNEPSRGVFSFPRKSSYFWTKSTSKLTHLFGSLIPGTRLWQSYQSCV